MTVDNPSCNSELSRGILQAVIMREPNKGVAVASSASSSNAGYGARHGARVTRGPAAGIDLGYEVADDGVEQVWRFGAARDLLRADGAEGRVAGFDRTATLDTALRANAVQEGVLRG